MPVTRTYLCDECGLEFSRFHMNRDEPAPDCPQCAQETHSIPGPFSITTNKAKAVDLTYQIAEQDFGMTDMRDNLREGDIAMKGPSHVQSAEAEQLTREMVGSQPELAPYQAEMVNQFWKNSMTGDRSAPLPGMPPMTPEANRDMLLATGAAASAEASGLGADPIGLLHEAGRKGLATTRLEVVNPKSTRRMAV